MKRLNMLDFPQGAVRVSKRRTATQKCDALIDRCLVLALRLPLLAALKAILPAAGPQFVLVPIPVRAMPQKRRVL